MIEINSWKIDDTVFRVGIVDKTSERKSIFRLRWGAYVGDPDNLQPGQIPPEYVPEQYRDQLLEVDWCDKHSIHLIGTRQDGVGEEKCVGTLRFILMDQGYLLKGESFGGELFTMPKKFPGTEELIKLSESVEASRWVAKLEKTASGKSGHMSMMLFHSGLEALRMSGKKYWFNALVHKKLSRINTDWPFIELGVPGPHLYHGGWFTVCVLRVPQDSAEDYHFDPVLL